MGTRRWGHSVFACLLLQCIFGPVVSVENIAFECTDGWDLLGTHCYKFVNVELDFEDALDVCEKYGSALLTVRDEVESRTVADVAKERFNVDHYWINNGQDADTEERPRTISNDSKCEGMWQPNQPMDPLNSDHGVAVASDFNGRWAVKWIYNNFPFVCRAPACSQGSFRCNDGMCLNEKWLCDGIPDCADQSDENECQNLPDCFKYYKQSSGTIDTQDFSDNDNCQWIIEGQPGEVLRIEFETLTLADNVDSLIVFTGGPSIKTSELLMEIREKITEKLILFSRNHYLIVILHSHATDLKAVIKANWMPDQELARGQVISLTATVVSQEMFTPYHDATSVPKNYKREFLITAPEGEIITMQVLDSTFNLRTAEKDFVQAINFGFELYDDINNTGVWISKSNRMSVIVKINNKENRVIRATFKTGCDFEISVLYLEYMLDGLPGDISCNWIVKNPTGTNFTLTITNLIDDPEDSLAVFDGTNLTEAVVLLTSSGYNSATRLIVDNTVAFKYTSDISQARNVIGAVMSIDCLPISDTSHMNMLRTQHRLDQYDLEITCEEGYSFKQEEYNNNPTLHARCNKGGQWDWGFPAYTRFPACQAVYCGVPPPIENGFIDSIGGNVSYQGVATYRCADGFTLQGPQFVTCQEDGTWSAAPICEAEKCSPVPSVSDGSYNMTAGNASSPPAGTIVTYNCNAGFLLKGAKQIVCLPQTEWSDSAPICERLFCPFLKIENGVYETSKPSKEPPMFEESLTLKCDNGYVINRTKTTEDSNIVCEADGQYNSTDDVCIDIDECVSGKHNCSDKQECFNVEGSFVCVCKRGYFGNDCSEMNKTNVCQQITCNDCASNTECDCFDGYRLYTANGTEGFFLPEGENGTRAGDVYHIDYSCVLAQCTDVPKSPDNGTVLTKRSSFHYNETVDFVCDFGYKLTGSASSLCNAGGIFVPQPPECKKQSCSQANLTTLKHEVSRIPSSGDIEPGDSLVIQCRLNDGSGKVINRTLFCAQDPDDHESFTLQGDSPECPEVDCGEPLSIPGAKHDNVTDTTYGNYFEFGCDATRGFKVIGESSLGNMTVICQSNGRWGYSNISCEGPQCSDPGTRAGTNQIIETSYEIDQIVRYNCTQPGFKPVPNDTLVCEYVNGKAQWSGEPPVCRDIQEPNVTCPENQELNLYDTLVYDLPQTTDNSGYSCLLLESGPPSGVSVVSKAMTVQYKAMDRELENTCSFNTTLSDLTGPEIQCPSNKEIDVAFNNTKMVNITKDMLGSSSGDGMVTMNPEGPTEVGVGDVIPIRVNITKQNGLSKGCAFLVRGVSTTCTRESLTSPQNGQISCDGTEDNLSCNVSCDSGYVFQDQTEKMFYSCSNGTWSPAQSLKPCIKLIDTIFEYDVTIIYQTGDAFVVRDDFDDNTLREPHNCLNSHYGQLTSLVENLSECGLNNFGAKSFKGTLFTGNQIKVSFKLTVSTRNGNITALQECAQTLESNTVALFGPTNPITNTTGKTCLDPWIAVNNANNEFIPGNDFACTGAEVVDLNGVKNCLPCGPGTSYDSTTKTCKGCENGLYQDMEGQDSCKQCPNIVKDSKMPRTTEDDCYETCPEGFESPTGYLKDGCTQCPEDTYNNGTTINCVACPDGGSTKGISGAYSLSQCSDPCQPGEYSITGYMPCQMCPVNFYSTTMNSTMCLECSSDKYTNSNGSDSENDCLSDAFGPCMDFCHVENTANNPMNCEIKDHRPICSCAPGYHGDSCNATCDLCDPDPCYNGGICESTGNNFTCKCPSVVDCVFEANDSLVPTSNSSFVYDILIVNSVSECEAKCNENSNCVAYLKEKEPATICYLYEKLKLETNANTQHYTGVKNCTTKELFEGRQCETDLTDDCTDDICSQRDFCRDLVGGTQCICPQGGGYDEKCGKADDLCLNRPCQNGGNCFSYGPVRYVCECLPGFTGSNCEININECEENPSGCLHGHQCMDGTDMYSCACGDGFSGDHCEMMDDLCAQVSCGEGGICYIDYKHFTANCSCGENYMIDPGSSSKCVAIKYCESGPCQNGAMCEDFVGGFTCQCLEGFEGSLCQHNIDDCARSPCQNGATCKDGVNSFSCTCLKGYSGDTCEVDIDDCTINCDNGGICKDKYNDYICQCPEEYTGKNCSEDYNECDQIKPCLHGGMCNNTMGGYICMCPEGWTGRNCEKVMDFCDNNNPCENSGTCYNLHNGTYCQCQPGTAGETCGRKADICGDFPDMICLKGTCTPEGGSAKCKCEGKKEPNCEFVEDKNISPTTNNTFIIEISKVTSSQICERNCDSKTDCVGYLVETIVSNLICYEYQKLSIDNNSRPNTKAYVKNCTVEEYYTGKSCELEKNHCAEDICNGGTCKLDGPQYECNCDNVPNFEGEKCDEMKDVCSSVTCPDAVACDTYLDPDGIKKPVCKCPATQILTGDQCEEVKRDFDLVFLEGSPDNNKGVTSERGFHLKKNSPISVAMWINAAKQLNDSNPILELSSSQDRDNPFLTIYNKKIQFGQEGNSTDYVLEDSLDKDNMWHFISVSWNPDGKFQIIQDIKRFVGVSASSPPSSDMFVFVHLGYGFHGYISQVSVWNSYLTKESSFSMSDGRDELPEQNNLLLGWTYYTYNERVSQREMSTAARGKKICDISNTIATSLCASNVGSTDKSPPMLKQSCDQERTFMMDYSRHQQSISSLYMFQEEDGSPGGKKVFPDAAISFGAFDTAFALQDDEGNTGICMTRIYVTSNKCSETAPSQNATQDCSENENGKEVKCPKGQMPSVPTPKYLTCGGLQTYNLNNMYEKPDRVVCGDVKDRDTKVYGNVTYIVATQCQSSVTSDALSAEVKKRLEEYCTPWSSSKSTACSNISVSGSCELNTMNVTLQLVINGFSETVESDIYGSQRTIKRTPFDLILKAFANKTVLDVSNIADAKLQTDTVMLREEYFCEDGYALSEEKCVQCGPGSYFDEMTKTCKLCELNMYSDQPGQKSCMSCGSGKATLQRGSNDVADCKNLCKKGELLNGTSGECEDCPKNFYQDQEGKDYCFPCPPSSGTETVGASDVKQCADFCPPGTQLNGTICVACPRGFYRDGNDQDQCQACPHANMTTPQNLNATSESDCNIPNCHSGSFVNESSCDLCKHGTYQPDLAQTRCLQCDANFTTVKEGAEDKSQCVFSCPPGHEEFPPDAETCRPCLLGYYRSDDLQDRFQNCSMCPKDLTTKMPGAVGMDQCTVPICKVGKYLNKTANECMECPLNKYQDMEQMEDCIPCPSGTKTPNYGSDSEDDCKFVCPPGKEVNQMSTACNDCPRGSYKDEDMEFEMCQNCSNDKTTDSVGSTSADMCNIDKCKAGFTVSVNMSCSACPHDTYQPIDLPTTAAMCMRCDNDKGTMETSSTSVDDCTLICKAGNGKKGDMCEICQQGFWNNGNLTMRFEECQKCPDSYTTEVTEGATDIANCTLRDCPPGEFIDSNNGDTCTPCEIGFYQPLPRQTTCEMCPPDRNTSMTGSTNETDCTVYCPAGKEGNATDECVPCPSDTFKGKADFGLCQMCIGDNTSTPADRTSCTMLFCDKGHEYINGTCKDCAVGFYKSMRGNTVCNPCPANLTTEMEASVNENDCSLAFCESGFYSKDNATCEPCPLGTYKSDRGNQECTTCLDSLTTDSVASKNASACYLKICPNGQFRNESNECELCGIGQYQDEEGQTQCKECNEGYTTIMTGSMNDTDCRVNCSAGSYRNESTNMCYGCPRGTYQESPGQASCTSCPSGYITDLENSTKESNCIVLCNAGSYRKDRQNCAPCEIGKYQNETNQDSCESCPRISDHQSTTRQDSSTSEDDCLPLCSRGYYLVVSLRKCEKCDVGFYKNLTSTQDDLDETCRQCSNGMTTDKKGSTSLNDCRLAICSKGQFMPTNSKTCEECPIGTYKIMTSLRNEYNCTDCPDGLTTLVKGATNDGYCITECGPGKEYIYSSNNCKSCEIGQFKNSDMKVCTYCPEGQTTEEVGQSQCSARTSGSPIPVVKTSVRVTIVISIDASKGRGVNEATIINVVVLLLQNQRKERYNGLCPTQECNNVNIAVKLSGISRRKRQANNNGTATGDVLIENVDSRLVENGDSSVIRDTGKVVEEAFYDKEPVEQILDEKGLAIVQITPSCPTGEGFNDARNCARCKSGQYSTSTIECEDCPKNTYSTDPVSDSCTPCQGDKVTEKTGSSQSSDCIVRENDSHLTLVAGIAGGVGAFLLVVLVIVAICAYKRRHQSRNSNNKSLVSENEFMDYKQPFYNPGMMIGDPTMFQGETLELYDPDPAVYTRDSRAQSHDANGERRGRSRSRHRDRDW